MKKRVYVVSSLMVTLFFSWTVSGGKPGIDEKQHEEKYYQTKKLSDEMIKKYSWEFRTDVTKDGKVMDILIESFNYGPDGILRKKIINDQEAKLPSSFIAHRIAEEIKTKMVTFMSNLQVFLQKYALDDSGHEDAFFSRAVIGDPDPNGEFLVACENIVVKGDKMLWWIDSRNYTLLKASVSTIFDGEKVEFTATYKNIPPGLSYMSFAEILVPEKSIIVQLHSYDYAKTD